LHPDHKQTITILSKATGDQFISPVDRWPVLSKAFTAPRLVLEETADVAAAERVVVEEEDDGAR
jgi:hypothetical protein